MDNNKRIEAAEDAFIADMAKKIIALERECKELKRDNDKLLRLIAGLSHKKTITLHVEDDDDRPMPEFELHENIAGEIIYTVKSDGEEEFIDLDRARDRRSSHVNVLRFQNFRSVR